VALGLWDKGNTFALVCMATLNPMPIGILDAERLDDDKISLVESLKWGSDLESNWEASK
jgi:hypothetical protein